MEQVAGILIRDAQGNVQRRNEPEPVEKFGHVAHLAREVRAVLVIRALPRRKDA